MDLLRWILLIAGVVIILLIYFISREKSTRRKWSDDEGLLDEDLSAVAGLQERASVLADDELKELGKDIHLQDKEPGWPQSHDNKSPHLESKGKPENRSPDKTAHNIPEKIIVIYLVSSSGEKFTGIRIQEALHKANLEFGDMNIFHRYPEDNAQSKEPVFSVANLVEPGTFDLASLAHMETPGLSLFISLSGQVDALKAFDLFMETANVLKQELGAELRDQSRSVLNRQAMSHMRDEVVEYCHQMRLAKVSRSARPKNT